MSTTMATECTQSYELHNPPAPNLIHYNPVNSCNAALLLVHTTYVVSSSSDSLRLLLPIRGISQPNTYHNTKGRMT